jgi:hypothetical protein
VVDIIVPPCRSLMKKITHFSGLCKLKNNQSVLQSVCVSCSVVTECEGILKRGGGGLGFPLEVLRIFSVRS